MGKTRRTFLQASSAAAAVPYAAGAQVPEPRPADVPIRQKAGFRIHPAIGVARVGDSGAGLRDPFAEPKTFYLAPDRIGGLPSEYTRDDPERRTPVQSFKDESGRVRRQAARFQVFREDADGGSVPVTLDDPDIASIVWRVHVANKKAAWHAFSEFQGNLMLGEGNSYERQGVPLRNAAIEDASDRQRRLIIDPGPRMVSQPGEIAAFDDPQHLPNASDPGDYRFVSFPGANGVSSLLGYADSGMYPFPIVTLGQMTMDSSGALLFLGGYGRAGGPSEVSIQSFAGADGFFDDISDGPVTATVRFTSGETLNLDAWVVTGSPKFAPELVNITTLDDIIFDMAVRHKGSAPEIYDPEREVWNEDFVVDFHQHILPVFERMESYQWVADVAPMVVFASPRFDISDNGEANRERRERWFGYLRNPGMGASWEFSPDHGRAFADGGFPLMPQNSGSNSITNTLISKFVSLTPTQYFLLGQWARGRFDVNGPRRSGFMPQALDRASVGNCVGAPMAPGIEVTWTLRNPAIYRDDDPYRILHESGPDYAATGLNPSRDETRGGGCQPGDLTKRMAIPWQADFFACTAQLVNFRDPLVNQSVERSLANFDANLVGHIPVPPTFLAHWWPPQSPIQVYSGAVTPEEQTLDGGVGLGEKVAYQRGVNTFLQTILAWKYLGFVVNDSSRQDRDAYPNFLEKERDYTVFRVADVNFTADGTLQADVPTETVADQGVNYYGLRAFYYVGPK